MTLPVFFADTETALIAPGLQAPPLVCLQFCVDDSAPQLIHVRDSACRRTIEWALAGCVWSFHHLAFDMTVICAAYPDLIESVFAAYDRDQVTCTMARQKLLDIASGKFKHISHSKGAYALDGVARRLRVDFELNKDDPWRTKYGTLYNVPAAQWPADAVSYALDDARAQRLVHRAQDAYSAQKCYPLDDQFRQARKALWTALMSCRGIMVDPARVDQYIADVRESLDEDRDVCADAGLVVWERTKWVKKTAPAMEYMVRICRETEEDDLPITETGEKAIRADLGLGEREPLPKGATWAMWEKHKKYVKLDEDSCQLYGDELLEAFQRYGTSTTQIARAERLRAAALRRVPIQSRFQSLGADTGRMTCSQGDVKSGTPSALGFQLQNPAKDKRVKRKDGTTITRKGTRELFVPRKATPELPLFYWDNDRQCYLPSLGFYFCSTDYGSMELCGWAQECIWKVGQSKLADVLNAGRDPHTELGATLAKISVEEAYARARGERGADAQKEFKGKYRQLGKILNFGLPGGMGPAKLALAARKQYNVSMSVAEAKAYKGAWLQTWPEAQRYFDWVNRQMDQRGTGEKKDRRVAVAQSKSGRVRGGMYYTQLCNTLFQGFCADIFGVAMWRITREMYTDKASPLFGSRVVNALHDEGFSEIVIERAHEAAHRQAQIQVEVGREWGPDVNWTCEPALMTGRWYKAAEPVYVDGKLVPWDLTSAV